MVAPGLKYGRPLRAWRISFSSPVVCYWDDLFASGRSVILGEICYNGNSRPKMGKADEIGHKIGHDVDGVRIAI